MENPNTPSAEVVQIKRAVTVIKRQTTITMGRLKSINETLDAYLKETPEVQPRGFFLVEWFMRLIGRDPQKDKEMNDVG